VPGKIAFVGEAWGAEEERARMPFVGPAGRIFDSLLRAANINRAECLVTNVFNIRPMPTNDIGNLCGKKKDVRHRFAPLSSGKYILDKYLEEVDRLRAELLDFRPNVVVALGGTATWCMLNYGGISRIRGTAAQSLETAPIATGGIKVLPTYHPAAVMRDWSQRPVTIADLQKAAREAEFPELRRPARTVYIPETIAELGDLFARHLEPARELAFDIETARGQITCIGFSPTVDVAVVVPFVDLQKLTGSYWPDEHDEVCAWAWVRQILDLPCPKVGQNGLYDLNFLWSRYGIPVRNYANDTMLLSHALQPELSKGLAFLGSVYTDEPAWKLQRSKNLETIKREA
jgi:DNA polymerase